MSDHSEEMAESASRTILPSSFWVTPWRFAVHATLGTLIFTIIAFFAVGLELAVHVLQAHHVGTVIILGLKAAEYGLFAVDLLLFGVFLWRTARRSIREL